MKVYTFHLMTEDGDEINFESFKKSEVDKFAEFIKKHYKPNNSGGEYDTYEI